MGATEDLVAACDKKDVKAATAALAAGADVNAKDDRGMSVLQTAIVLKSKALAKLLVEAGADVNATDDNGRAALHWLAEELPEPDLAALVIDKGAVIDRVDTEEYEGKSALHRAVKRPKLDFAQVLIDRGANLGIKDAYHGDTPLHALCRSESGDMSKTEVANALWLLERGADIAATNDNLETPLHLAAGSSTEMTKALLAKGAQITLSKQKATPLSYCLSTNDKDTARWDLLIAAGCDVNHVDANGDTPVLEAQVSWNPTAVAYLIGKGADLSVRDSEGKTIVERATELKQDKILKVLNAAATKPVAAKPAAAKPAAAKEPAPAKAAKPANKAAAKPAKKAAAKPAKKAAAKPAKKAAAKPAKKAAAKPAKKPAGKRR